MRDGAANADFDPQMAAALAKFEALGRGLTRPRKPALADVRRLDLEQRRWFNEDAPELWRIDEESVAGPLRVVPVRIYRPAPNAKSAIVYFHGGGWFTCSNDTHDRIMRLLARFSGAAVIGVDYCLAPEHKFPRAIEEASAVLIWLTRRGGEWGFDSGRLAFGGCSAGANIALGASLALDRGVLRNYRAGMLFYGPYDPDLNSESCRQFGGGDHFLGVKEMAWCWKTYLARDDQRDDPRAAPLRATTDMLAKLPPLYLCAAGIDPLRDDTVRLAERLRQAGVSHELSVRGGLGHSFLGFTRMVDGAVGALEDAAKFVAHRVGSTARDLGI